jgi:hypothetical protein
MTASQVRHRSLTSLVYRLIPLSIYMRWADWHFKREHPHAEYTVGYVMRDGNPHDISSHGNSLLSALRAREREERKYASKYDDPRQARYWCHFYIYDREDEERGYFGEESLC